MNDMENVQFAIENNLLNRAASNCMQKWIKVNWRTAHENNETMQQQRHQFQCEIQFERETKTRFSIKFRDFAWHIKQTAEHLKYQQSLAHFTRSVPS